MSFLSELAKVSKNEYASIVSDGTTGDCTQYLDSGVYLLNALVSGSIYGGFPGNRITAIAGESSTGKCVRGSEKIVVYCNDETYNKLLDSLK